MTARKFKTLEVGDQVTLAERVDVYGCGFPTTSGRAYIRANTTGTIGAVCVPSVRRTGVCFHCVDFPPDTPLVDYRGDEVDYDNRHNSKYRVGVLPDQIEVFNQQRK